MDDKLNYQNLAQVNDASYEDIRSYFSAKRKILLSSKNAKVPLENSAFLQACSKIYTTNPFLFSESTYEILKQHPDFTEEIVNVLRPAALKALFGNFKNMESVVGNRIFILSILQKNKILNVLDGKIQDHDWIRFLTAIDPAKLDEFARVFTQIESIELNDPEFFARIKSHSDLDDLAKNLQSTLELNQTYDIKPSIAEETQIKGFTLINEYVCKRTRFFPKPWKQAMKKAWEQPNLESSFELYKLYSERLNWLNSYSHLPIIYKFLSYFYGKSIFQKFNTEPLTQVCKLLQEAKILDLSNYTVLADIPETGLAFCSLLASKGILTTEYVQNIKGIPEIIIQNISSANEKQRMTATTLNVLLKLGKQGIDGTHWLPHKPDWLIVSQLSESSLKMLGSLEPNESIFEAVTMMYEQKFISLFEHLNEVQQKSIVTSKEYEKITTLLQHFENIGLFTKDNVQIIFDNQSRIIADNTLLQSLLNLEKINISRNQKRFNRIMHNERLASRTTTQAADTEPSVILDTLPDEEIARTVQKNLRDIAIILPNDELEAYSPSVLSAFNAAIPLFKEDNLLTQQNVKKMLRLFSAAPDPKIRCRAMIILSQCCLLTLDKLKNGIQKLELIHTENPELFQQVYAESWVQTDTTPKWLEKTLESGLQTTDFNENAEETLIQRFLIENEENCAYLALDDTKKRIALHGHPPLVQQTLKLFDKSKLKIENILDDLLDTNTEQIQKIYYWLFILDKAELLDANNAKKILQSNAKLYGDIDFVKNTVLFLKSQPDFKMNTALKQKNVDQLLSQDINAATKQKTLDYMHLVMNNPTAAAKMAFMVSDAADIAGEKAVVVQDHIVKTAGVVAAAATATATDMTKIAYSKFKLFSAAIGELSKPSTQELLTKCTSVAMQSKGFNGSYYHQHSDHLYNDLNTLLNHDLLTESNVQWLVKQPNQERASRCLKLLAQANMLRNESWQNNLTRLAAYDLNEFTKLEAKCSRVLNSKVSQNDKECTLQLWLDPIINSGNKLSNQ